MRIHRLFFHLPGTIFQDVMKDNMKSRTDLTTSELYAAARLARAREMGRLIRAGVDALVRFAKRAVAVPDNRKGINHA